MDELPQLLMTKGQHSSNLPFRRFHVQISSGLSISTQEENICIGALALQARWIE